MECKNEIWNMLENRNGQFPVVRNAAKTFAIPFPTLNRIIDTNSKDKARLST